MDLGEKENFGLEKSKRDQMDYHPFGVWQNDNPVSMVESSPSFWNNSIYSQNFSISPSGTAAIGKPATVGPGSDTGCGFSQLVAGISLPSLSPVAADSTPVDPVSRFPCSNAFGASSSHSPENVPKNELHKGVLQNASGVGEEMSSSGEAAGDSSSKDIGSKRRKRTDQEDMELEQGQVGPQLSAEKDSSEAPKEDYVHVRARRGHATNSHSLAERLRREKISERMKLLQELVPGCSKVTGKAVMLDEIINYVQSLQRQVEFLSMKLAAVNPRFGFDIEGILSSKDLIQWQGGAASAIGFSPDMIHPQFHPSQQSLIPAGIPAMLNHPEALRRAINSQFTRMNPYKEAASQMANTWDDDLHNVVQMTYGTNTPLSNKDQMESLLMPSQTKP